MEIECEDGTNTLLKNGFKREIGRGLGFDSKDRTNYCRHVSFELRTHSNSNANARGCFEVIGNIPCWYTTAQVVKLGFFGIQRGGEVEAGDMFCVSAKKSVWFAVKILEFEKEEERESWGVRMSMSWLRGYMWVDKC
ncbi:hypothetical protein Acr_23g0001280 [Actinidia rufa]|uniref:SMAD/FHA domain-containing protein n=1 Tax=Actinidia rufa TaxID=165716 RepID=A0A7J0GLR1_9ERIC|nr:hypothetical protein Acr_23g0001280 [Actinidia rufa]